MEESAHHGDSPDAGRHFRTTRWTQVRKAHPPGSPSAAEALSQLCRDYWYPLYAYVRRRGCTHGDAEDLTQDFFARLLEKQTLQHANQDRGRFRTFLITSVDHFLCNEWEKRKAQKRGGQYSFISLDEQRAEERYTQEPFHELTAEKLFERRWALTVLEMGMEAMRREYAADGQQALFETLQDFLSRDHESESYQQAAARLNISEDAVKMRVHRLKKRFGKVLREVVADTVDEAEVDDEMRHLFEVWN